MSPGPNSMPLVCFPSLVFFSFEVEVFVRVSIDFSYLAWKGIFGC